MIRFFEENDKKYVISVWKDAFGDKEDFISDFLHLFGKYMLVLEYEGRVVSMLTLFPVKIGEKSGRYVYAVATDKKYRSRGFAGKLVEYAKRFAAKNDENFLVILPQNDGLYDFYRRFGFSELKCVKRINEQKVNFNDSALNIEIIDENEYFKLRKNHFATCKFVEWDIHMLAFFKKVYEGFFVKVSENGREAALAFCFKNGDSLSVPELLTKENETIILSSLCCFFEKESVTAIKESKCGEKFAMIYPEEFTDCYFGLGMN